MSRNRILLCLILISLGIYANASAPSEKEFKKWVEKYDVSDSAKVLAPNSPEKFWNRTLYGNELLIKFKSDINQNRGAEKEAKREYDALPKFYPQYNESIIQELQGFCDTILLDMGISSLPFNCSLHIIYSDEVNSFTVPTEDGFAICVTSALTSRKGMKYEILMGYVAHEFAHGALEHHMRSLYAGAKERRKNELFAGIALGLNAVGSGLNAAVAAQNGQYYNYQGDFLQSYYTSIAMENQINASTLKYMFDYNIELEYEADLIAYRFVEYMFGSGEDYINGLRIIGSVYNQSANNTEQTISSSSRINFLKFVKDNPDLGNKINARLLKSRTKKIYPPAQF